MTSGKRGIIHPMNSMSLDELLFFASVPAMLPVYETLRGRLTARYPDMGVSVRKTQITFRNRYGFAMVSMPWRKVRGRPAEYVLVSFVLPYRRESARIEAAVQPYPNRWTHHVVVSALVQVDEELMSWLAQAYDFAMIK